MGEASGLKVGSPRGGVRGGDVTTPLRFFSKFQNRKFGFGWQGMVCLIYHLRGPLYWLSDDVANDSFHISFVLVWLTRRVWLTLWNIWYKRKEAKEKIL